MEAASFASDVFRDRKFGVLMPAFQSVFDRIGFVAMKERPGTREGAEVSACDVLVGLP
jgi:hypothetical protein